MSEPTYTPPLAGLPPVTVEIARPVDSPPLDPAELERWLLSDLAAHPRGPRMNEREPTPDDSALERAVFARKRPPMAHWDRAALDRLSDLELARLRVSVKHSVFCSPFPADNARWAELAGYCRTRAPLPWCSGTPPVSMSWTAPSWSGGPALLPEHRPRVVSGLGLIGRMVAALGAWLGFRVLAEEGARVRVLSDWHVPSQLSDRATRDALFRAGIERACATVWPEWKRTILGGCLTR